MLSINPIKTIDPWHLFKGHLSKQDFQQALFTSEQTQSTVFHTLLIQNLIQPTEFLTLLSRHFKVDLYQGSDLLAVKNLEPQLDTIIQTTHHIQARFKNAAPCAIAPLFEVIEPRHFTLLQLASKISLLKNLRKPILLTDANSFKGAIENRYQHYLTNQAVYSLQQKFHNASACTLSLRSFFKATPIILLSSFILLFALLTLSSSSFMPALYFLGLLFTPFFMALIALRLWAIIHLQNKHHPSAPSSVNDTNLPIYTLLIPLYREAEMLPSLVEALKNLHYPKEKLDIKLLLESNDQQTQNKANSLNLPDYFDCLIIPESLPKTKPKALNYGLHFARGDYLVIYDAEDRPQKDQLLKAVYHFLENPSNLACVQAKLNIYNSETNWLTRQFTLEYNALFSGLLPALAQLNLPFLLGGTSNHFNTSALKQAGGWDAFNVTEDADLGIRLHRLGYRCSTIDSTTYEESCAHFSDWLKQRTRWLKGWMQTYCVHMKSPYALWKDLGLRGFICFQVILGGQILASLSYLLFVIILLTLSLYHLMVSNVMGSYEQDFLLTSLSLFFISYSLNAYLGYLSTKKQKDTVFLSTLLSTPLYWGFISAAALRGLFQLYTRPFYWEKTQHGHSLK